MTPDAKEKFYKMLEELTNEKADLIRSEVKIDHKHLELVNLCATSFSPLSKLSNETQYEMIIYEPLFRRGIKTFDVAIYNAKSKQLILIECKSSITYLKRLSEEIRKSIKDTLNNKGELENIIGDEIKDIEYVYCVPAMDAIEFGEYVRKEGLTICIWFFDGFKNILKLYAQRDETNKQGIDNGHLHKNSKLTRTLSKGVDVSSFDFRSVPFLPSSHIYTILMDVSMTIIRKMMKQEKWNGEIKYGDIYHVINSNIASPNTLTKDDLMNITINVIKKGRIKKIFHDQSNNVKKIEGKIYQIDNKAKKINKTEGFIKTNFVDLNAKKMADEKIFEKYKKETGAKDLKDYFK